MIRGKREFSHLHPLMLFPIRAAKGVVVSKNTQERQRSGKGIWRVTSGWKNLGLWGGGQVCRKLVSGFSSRCVAQPCEQSEGNVHGVGSAGKKNSDPSRYLNNVSWLEWNALVRPSGGEFDIFCATCSIKRKCCWLLHCLLEGTEADRNVIKLPAAFICCHSSPRNECNNNFIYSLSQCLILPAPARKKVF